MNTTKKRKLFCEISPLTYKISWIKNIVVRNIKDACLKNKFSKELSKDVLPVVVYEHSSLIRRKLGNVDAELQNNKATNLSIAAPKVNGIIIKPGETFSFWKLVGSPSKRKGYKAGLTIVNGNTSKGIGGGMCQFTNLIHWMALHTPLDIVEYHHHDEFDLFPDFGRKVPFGTGTSIYYNYLDYRIQNNTNQPYQIIVYTTDEYLCGEIRTTEMLTNTYHVNCEEEYFSRENGIVYRNNKIYRKVNDRETGKLISKTCIKENHAKVMYDSTNLEIIEK